MRSSRLVFTVTALAATIGLSPAVAAQQPARSPSWSAVDSVLGRRGAPQADGATKYGFPRGDLTVVVGGVTVKPAFALGSWIAFDETAPGAAMVMGDLVLTEGEVGPVMRALQRGGIRPTALHNHLLMETPRLMYMHVEAHGDPVTIAGVIRTALAQSRTPLGAAAPPATPDASGLDTAAIVGALGHRGKLNGVVYQVAVPRAERITEGGHLVPPSMGVATSINFQPTGLGRAAVTGDFVLQGSEVNGVARALLAHGIQPTAIHSHMLTESPRLFFMHFWGNDDAVALARGLKAALDETTSR